MESVGHFFGTFLAGMLHAASQLFAFDGVLVVGPSGMTGTKPSSCSRNPMAAAK